MKAPPPAAIPLASEGEFDLLQEMAGTIVQAAEILAASLNGKTPIDRAWQDIRDLEHKGDAIARDLFEMLLTPRRSQPDQDSLRALTGYLDDVLDGIEAAAARLAIYRIRRAIAPAGTENRLTAGRLIMDVDRHEVTIGDAAVPLSSKEFALLQLLLRHQGKVVRRERLASEVWGDDYFGDTRTLDTQIGWLGKKIERRGTVRLISVRGVGYRLDLRQ